MQPETARAIREAAVARGTRWAWPRVAAIMGAKRTSELIALCHPLPITSVEADFEVHDTGVRVLVTARVTGETEVEMVVASAGYRVRERSAAAG